MKLRKKKNPETDLEINVTKIFYTEDEDLERTEIKQIKGRTEA